MYSLNSQVDRATVAFGQPVEMLFDLMSARASERVVVGHVSLQVETEAGVDVTPAARFTAKGTVLDLQPGERVTLVGRLGDEPFRFALRRGTYRVTATLNINGLDSPVGSTRVKVTSAPVDLEVR